MHKFQSKKSPKKEKKKTRALGRYTVVGGKERGVVGLPLGGTSGAGPLLHSTTWSECVSGSMSE
jgi:hypothetical protein